MNPESETDTGLYTFDDARAAVAGGTDPDVAAARLVETLSPEEKLWCLDGDAPTWVGLDFLVKDGYHMATFKAAHVERVGLPGIAFSDGPRGVVIGNATCFPVSMARGATWDPVLEEQIGDAIGIELRASGATLYGGVCVNLLRHPAWGRAQETYGEDPHHVGEMGAALTRGIQRHAMACVKHFACNSMENARFRVDITIDETALHEVYLPHFKRIVDEGVGAVMTAYNSVNGQWCGQNEVLLTEILRDEWGFKGFVISDWILGLRDAAMSVSAGLDIEMPYRMVRAGQLPAALESGESSWADVDASVTRLVSTLLRFDDILSTKPPAPFVIASREHRELARVAAARSVLLLRNEPVGEKPVLPMSLDDQPSIAVLGRIADLVNLGDGGSSDVWALDCVTVLGGIESVAPNLAVEHDQGDDLDRAATLAASKDIAIVVVGYTYEDEGEFIGDAGVEMTPLFSSVDEPDVVARFRAEIEDLRRISKPDHIVSRQAVVGFAKGGDRTTLELPAQDVALINAVSLANPRTIVVLQAGSAVVSAGWDRSVPAIVQSWYGGAEAGNGLADVLFGTVNPSARLPFSVPTDSEHLPPFDLNADKFVYDRWHGWWHLEKESHVPAYPFGFGLSYTTFELGPIDCDVSADSEVSAGTVDIQGSVANTGLRDGADVVQVYVKLPDPDAPRRLVGFVRVEVAAGESEEFSLRIPLGRMAFRDLSAHSWKAPAGNHVFEVARFAGDPDARSVTIEL